MRLRHAYPYGEVLLDVWVVRRYRGEPRGLDGQALRWCGRAAADNAELLPADRPIVAALRLPERLAPQRDPLVLVRSFEDFRDSAPRRAARPRRDGEGRAGRRGATPCRALQGCREAAAAARAGADFLAPAQCAGGGELAALCERVPVPIFARGRHARAAWAQGATGSTRCGLASDEQRSRRAPPWPPLDSARPARTRLPAVAARHFSRRLVQDLGGPAVARVSVYSLKAFDRDRAGAPPEPSRAQVAIAVPVACAWTVCGGTAHLVFANADWHVRDAVLHDLVTGSWPVAYASPDGVRDCCARRSAYYLAGGARSAKRRD